MSSNTSNEKTTKTNNTVTSATVHSAIASSGLFDHEVSTPRSTLLTCSFNQDGGCLAVGTTTGFSIHSLHPSYSVSVSHDAGTSTNTNTNTTKNHQQSNNNGSTNRSTFSGGIGKVELLFRCNLMLLVGGGPNPYMSNHRVVIWDDHIPKPIGELSFRQCVLGMRLRKDTIAVALLDRCYLYDLATLTLRDKIYTDTNPHGLLCLSTSLHSMVFACPAVTTGHVRIELYASRKTVLIVAHESSLRAIVLTADGSRLATSSEKGTVIRVFDVNNASCIQEFRRGFERATITCLAWSWDAQFLACSSDKGTCHIFHINDNTTSTTTTESTKNNKNNNGKYNRSNDTSDVATSLTQMILSSVRKSVEGDAKKSICQVRGIPHPLACAFIGEASSSSSLTSPPTAASTPSHPTTNNNTTSSSSRTIQLAVAGWDADGNGVLLISECYVGDTNSTKTTTTTNSTTSNSSTYNSSSNDIPEPKRIGYHILCRSEQTIAMQNETDDGRRRRRLRGWTPDIPPTPDGTEPINVRERFEEHDNESGTTTKTGANDNNNNNNDDNIIMNDIRFDDNIDDDDFVSIVTSSTKTNTTTTNASSTTAKQQQQQQSISKQSLSTTIHNQSLTTITTKDTIDGSTSQHQHHEQNSNQSSVVTEPFN